MAKRMAAKAAEEVQSKGNLTGIDLGELKKGIEGLIERREDVAVANGEASGVMKRMEKELGINPAGVRMALTLYKMTEEKRNDVLRTFQWACKAMEVPIQPQPDLVDAMGGA